MVAVQRADGRQLKVDSSPSRTVVIVRSGFVTKETVGSRNSPDSHGRISRTVVSTPLGCSADVRGTWYCWGDNVPLRCMR